MKKQVRKEQDEKETLVDWLKGIGLVGIRAQHLNNSHAIAINATARVQLHC